MKKEFLLMFCNALAFLLISSTLKADSHNDHVNRNTVFEGRWYDHSSGTRLEIEAAKDGYRVRSQNGSWERFRVDQRGNRLRSKTGATIRLLDRNTIHMTTARGRMERTYVRQRIDRSGNRFDEKDRDHIYDKRNNGRKVGHRAKSGCCARNSSCG